VKYDWYDPNAKVETSDIGKPSTNLTFADIKYSTLGIGYARYFNDHIKMILFYEFVKNETTQLPGFTADQKDNIFTCRLQYRF
jgi:phosphate-selective porin